MVWAIWDRVRPWFASKSSRQASPKAWTSLDEGSCHLFVYSLRHSIGLLDPFFVPFSHLLFLSFSPWVSLLILWLLEHPQHSCTSVPSRAFRPSSLGDFLLRKPQISWTSIQPWRLLAVLYHLLHPTPKFLGWSMLHRISRFPSLLAWWWANSQLAFLDAIRQRSDKGRHCPIAQSCQWTILIIWWTIP